MRSLLPFKISKRESKSFGRIAIFSLTLFVSMLCFEAKAFEVDGFKNGMSIKEVKENLDSWKFDKIDEKEDYIFAYDRPDKVNFRVYEFGFCRNKLDFLRKNFEPSIKNFILLFNKLSSIYGTNIKGDSSISVTSFGEMRSMSLIWKQRLQQTRLIYNIFPNNEQLSIEYRISDECSK